MGSSYAKPLECFDSHPVEIASLCYKKCPKGMEHIPGAPTFCKPIGDVPISYTPPDDPGTPLQCGKGRFRDGELCYDNLPPGWTSKAGLARKNDCPPGSKDDGELLCIPGAGTGPWYFSIYIFIAAWILSGVCILYFRYGMKAQAASSGMSAMNRALLARRLMGSNGGKRR